VESGEESAEPILEVSFEDDGAGKRALQLYKNRRMSLPVEVNHTILIDYVIIMERGQERTCHPNLSRGFA
jgi:hypothetical protein